MNLDNRALGSLGLDSSALNSGVWRRPGSTVNGKDLSVSLYSPDVCRQGRPSESDMYSDTGYRSSLSAASFEHLYRTESFGRAKMNLDNRALGSLGLDSSALNSGVWRRPSTDVNGNSSLHSILNESYDSHADFTPPYNSTFYITSELSSGPDSYITYGKNRLPRKITKRSDSESNNATSSNVKTASRQVSESNTSTYSIWENSYISPPESDLNELQLRIHNILNPDSNSRHSADHMFECSNSDHEDLSNSFCQLLQNHYFPETNQYDASPPSSELISNIAKIWKSRAITSARVSNHSSYAQEQFVRIENFPDQNDLFDSHSTPQNSFYSPRPSSPVTVPQRSLTFQQIQNPNSKINHIWTDRAIPNAQISNHSSYPREQFENFPFNVNDLCKTPNIYHSTPQKSFCSPSCDENVFQIESSYAPTTMPQRQPSIGAHDKSTPLLENPNQKGLRKMLKANSSNWCNFCMKNGESSQVYSNHPLKEKRGKKLVVACPILRSFVCQTCKATGDNAHTETYCPILTSRNNGQRIPSTTINVKTTRTKSNGQRRY